VGNLIWGVGEEEENVFCRLSDVVGQEIRQKNNFQPHPRWSFS